MEYKLPKYFKPLNSMSEPYIDKKSWELAKEAFEKEEYKKSAIYTISYINPKAFKGIDTSKDIKINSTHSNIDFEMVLTSKEFALKVELVEVDSNTNTTALFRKVAELNFDYSNIVQLVLKDDRYLVFDYKEDLELLHPWKLYDVIMNIFFFCNDHLFLFIEEYKAKPIKPIKKQKLSKKNEDLVLNQIKELLDEYEKRREYLIKNLKSDYRWDILAIILFQLSNMPYLQGKLYKELIEKIDILYDEDLDIEKKIHLVENYIEELKGLDDNYLRECIYNVDYFVPQRRDKDLLEEFLIEEEKTLQKIKDNHFAVSHFLFVLFLRLKYRFHLTKKDETLIDKTLFLISYNQPEKDVAERLIRVYDKLLNQKSSSNLLNWLFG